MDIFSFLDQHEISYQRCDHPPVYTVAEAEEKVPPMPGADLKNLFIRNRKGTRFFLVVVGYETRVDLKGLATLLDEKKLNFASPEQLDHYLGIEPGSVSLLAIVNDTESEVEVVVDADIWQAEILKCHPLVNTSTLSLSRLDMERILELTGHSLSVVKVPKRA
ncbi:MAG: prolyl-tRNA synthetase associated domain-containing protein [Chloroflexota bacterium]